MSNRPRCELLPWDSDFFGRPIARVNGAQLTAAQAERADRWCKTHDIACLYLLADADDPATARIAQRRGFRMVDVRVTLEAPSGGTPSLGGVRVWRREDLEALRAIARLSHRDSRFYCDGNFPRDRCDELYAAWIERSCAGYADEVLVLDWDGQAAGYVSCHCDLIEGRIGLLGVAAAAQGRGGGTALVNAALQWFGERGLAEASVVTQGRNVRAQRLYQGCGFKTRSVQVWFHRWFQP